uniref:Uncharacterized protein n=1 Tax=Arundo donax TaxID=35708 RepID=A0A0A8Z1E6_ARUDO
MKVNIGIPHGEDPIIMQKLYLFPEGIVLFHVKSMRSNKVSVDSV